MFQILPKFQAPSGIRLKKFVYVFFVNFCIFKLSICALYIYKLKLKWKSLKDGTLLPCHKLFDYDGMTGKSLEMRMIVIFLHTTNGHYSVQLKFGIIACLSTLNWCANFQEKQVQENN